MYIEIRHIT